MIREHAFDSAWWGNPIGIITDNAFFFSSPAQQAEILKPYHWVEYRAVGENHPPLELIHKAGFFHADTQILFRILLKGVPITGIDELSFHFADEAEIRMDSSEMALFKNERFTHLPGVTEIKLKERYAQWSQLLIREYPRWCLEISINGDVQGWYLSKMTKKGLNLSLAMLHRNAKISGLHLYQKAIFEYYRRGASIGWARFSTDNISVLNIYSFLGARFTGVEHFWMYVR